MKDLIRIALLGSDRTELPESLREEIKALGVEDKDRAKAILRAVTKWQMQQKAAYIPPRFEGEWPLAPDTANERFCSPNATKYLQQIMDGKYEQVLPEFFSIAKSEACFLPPEQVPTLLQQASENPGQAALLKPLMGAHAKWLAAQHPEWSLLFAETAIEDWPDVGFQQRVHIFRKMRERNISVSLELLQSVWKDIDFRQKKSFLKVMRFTVCLEDEVILEVALTDKRKEVRKVAAELLQSIPESKLLQRVWQGLEELVHIKKGKDGEEKPEVQLPNEISPAMLRDGIDPSQQWLRGGLRASRLGQMMAIIPPGKWEEKFKRAPTKLIEIFAQSDYAIILLQSFSHAATLHRNDDWAIAILEFWLYHHHLDRWVDFMPKQLCENLSAEAFNRIAIPALEYCDQLPTDEDPITILIRKNTHPWNESLTQAFIMKCKEWISEYSSSYWTAIHLKSIIQNASYHIEPKLADSLTKSWPTTSAAWGSWESDIETFFKVLRFRKGMKEALKEERGS
ncbi:MAG: hypothetical protein ACI8YQ_002217 [Polaribacter sp.]|jgi:hypothetical protein